MLSFIICTIAANQIFDALSRKWKRTSLPQSRRWHKYLVTFCVSASRLLICHKMPMELKVGRVSCWAVWRLAKGDKIDKPYEPLAYG